jgi:signal transduction histidine kinase
LGVNKHADPTKIDAGIHMLLRRKPDERTLRDVGGHIRNSTKRMAALIDDMLDLAKGRIGGGFSLDRNPDAPLYEHLEQVIGELRDVSENRIEANIALVHPVNCDPKRIAQVASNLVGNALKHGAPHRCQSASNFAPGLEWAPWAGQ